MDGGEASLASLPLALDFLPPFYWGCAESFYGAKARMHPILIEVTQLLAWSIP
jgi:hypothetical protein